jgi:hypothetical protein
MYKTKQEMYDGYLEWCADTESLHVVECNFEANHSPFYAYHVLPDGKSFESKKIAVIFYYWGAAGVGVMTHELIHAAFWAYKFNHDKEQYPLVINNIDEEEEIAYSHTLATRQLYTWYWKIEPLFEKTK